MKNNNFKIHSICVVKNEVDIIEYCLQKASEWSDYIYVYDNGSSDGTWERIQQLKSDKIIPWKQDGKPFKEALRGEVFNEFRSRAQEGDWWCRLDSDEFYVQSPKEFLSQVQPSCHVVWGIAVEYYLTQEDLASLDFSQPTESLLSSIKHYRSENSEPRFFRYRKGLEWGSEGSWPNHMGIVEKKRIFYRHYKYRFPEQIQTRLDTRRLSRERGFPGWDHASQLTWNEKIDNSRELFVDNGSDEFNVFWSRLPKHVELTHHRLIKYLMHGLKIWP